MPKVWMKPPDGGEAIEVEATPEQLTPLMVLGYTQWTPPVAEGEEHVG